jgi:hypothetical protein
VLVYHVKQDGFEGMKGIRHEMYNLGIDNHVHENVQAYVELNEQMCEFSKKLLIESIEFKIF